MTASVTTPIGGAWLIEDVTPADVFTRERLNDEQRMIGQTAEEFIDKEVLPVLDRLEQKDWALVRRLGQRSGELGLLATDVPEAYRRLDPGQGSAAGVRGAVSRGAAV